MSTPSVSASSFSAASEVRQPIVIDWSKFPTYAGLRPDDVVVTDWGKDMTQKPLLVDELLESGSNLKSVPSQKTNQPIALKFQTAVALMLEWINNSRCENGQIRVNYPEQGKSLYEDILQELLNVKTPQPTLLSRVPRSGAFNSASQDHVNWLFGAIIHMLYDAKLITDYGQRGVHYFLQVRDC